MVKAKANSGCCMCIVHECIEVRTITKDLIRTERTESNLKYCTRFCKQWCSKRGDNWGHTFLRPGLGGVSTHVAVI